MPASGYSHYLHPETGETVLLPQLFPLANCTGEFSSTELEAWVNAGIIPKELYESDLQSKQKMEEIHKRLQNGEQLQTSELPLNSCALSQYLLENKARLYGENVLTKIFSRLADSDEDIIWLSFVYEAILSITSTDPLPIHFYTVRKILKEKYNIEDSRAVDILCRELLKHCKNISKFKCFQHPALKKNPIGIEDLSDHLKNEKQKILQIDADFINYLKKLGAKGKKLASEVENNSKELFKFYEEEHYSSLNRRKVWGLWVPDNELTNHALLLLTQTVWEEECSRLWNRETRGHSSLAKPVIDGIIPILGPKKLKKFIEKDGSIICYHDGVPLLIAPAIDQNMISAFQKGVKELSTLTGHKLLRWQVNTGFERWAQGNPDPRSIEIEGGYSKIAELIKCCNPREIAKIKEILHAQAHGRFIFSDGSYGNMLSLRITERYQNKEPSKINIVLGDMLLPAYVCQLQRSDRRLVPIGDLPPLHGSPNSHASQAQLQLLVFKEFSSQSDRLAQEGSVVITLEQWKQLAQESGLSHDKIELVIEYWCQPDMFNCFLERQGDEYRLASYYDRAQKFLEDQGKGRLINSQRGKRSAEKKIKDRKK
jgi:hypothetical protein